MSDSEQNTDNSAEENVVNIDSNTEEKAIDTENAKNLGVEIRTNTRLRQKYFVDESTILTSMGDSHFKKRQRLSKVIRAPKVKLSAKPVQIRCSNNPLVGEIKVDVIRDGDKIKAIHITCPCGRHAELDCQYNPTTVSQQKT